MSQIIFEVQEDEVDGGYVAAALGHGIVTQGDTLDELRTMVKDAVHSFRRWRSRPDAQDHPASLRS